MSVDLEAGASLQASIAGLCARMDREAEYRQHRAMHAAQEYRQIPFVINLTISSGTGSVNPAPQCGPPSGYYWSIRRMSATGFSAGTVIVFIDSTSGEPINTYTGASIGSYVSTWGKGHQMMHPGSTLAVTATGITGTVTIYGSADQIETHLLPWYAGAVRS